MLPPPPAFLEPALVQLFLHHKVAGRNIFIHIQLNESGYSLNGFQMTGITLTVFLRTFKKTYFNTYIGT